MKIFKRLLIFALVFSVALFSISAQSKPPKKAEEKPLPNLVLNTIDGKKWSLYENRGKVVLMNFWATWCEPCRTETPMLVKLSGEFRPRGLKIVGIVLDENGSEKIKKFITEYKVHYPVLLPVSGSALSRIDPVPTTILIDGEGRLAKKYVGELPEDILRKDIEKLTNDLKQNNEIKK